jgi:membrane protein implicated in regulation of membrane protease activity
VLILIAIALLIFVLPPALGIAIVVVAALFEVGEFLLWRRVLDRYRVVTGAEGLVGRRAVVAERCDPQGTVRVGGEIWRARCDEPAGPGQAVEVVSVEGLTLHVRLSGT